MNRIDRSSDAHEADSNYSKAAKAELAKDYNLAFGLYVKSAELYLHISRSNHAHEVDRSKWKANAGKALQRAEKIKAFVDSQRGVSSTQHIPTDGLNEASADTCLSLTPIGIDHFSTQEQTYVLRKGASVNGLVFPSWNEPITSASSSSVTYQYQDPEGQPKLSPEQSKVSPVWRSAINNEAGSLSQDSSSTNRRILPQEIVQHVVTDCSVCASISVCLEHGRRFGSNLAEAAVYDNLDQTRGRTSPNVSNKNLTGRFDVKVLFNGAWRRIVVDDKLPYHPTDGTLMCMSVQGTDGGTRGIVWPSILEKAYMKLLGGYDFPGSAIAGWIPEHVEIRGSSFEREKTWERMHEGFRKGHCMLTLGTGTCPDIPWDDVELLPSHSYAVIDVVESESSRILTVLDTWVNPNHADEARALSKTLHVPWSDVLNIFDGIYMSWDPSQWADTLSFHGMWRRGGQTDQSSTRQLSLKFKNTSQSPDEEIWVLLTRHVVDSSRTSDFISLKVEVEDDLKGSAIAVDRTTIAAKGTYTNSTHVLVRTKILESQSSGVLSIYSSYDGHSTEIGFTVTAYAREGFTIAWDENVSTPPFTNQVEGVLTNKNAGGNCTYPTFMLNPQYHLQIHTTPPRTSQMKTKAKVTLTMQTGRDIPVNISVAYSQGGRIDELVETEMAASSGPYCYGVARVTKDFSPGDYTVILSAFEPHYMGPFSLKLDSSLPFKINPIPQEGAGMYTKVVRGAWNLATAAGGPTSERYSKNPIFEIDVPSLMQLKIRLQLLRPSTATALNVTIFPTSPDGFLRRHITTSGPYNDAISGVVTPQVSLRAGKYWAVPSTYNPGVEAGFQLFVYTSIGGVGKNAMMPHHVPQQQQYGAPLNYPQIGYVPVYPPPPNYEIAALTELIGALVNKVDALAKTAKRVEEKVDELTEYAKGADEKVDTASDNVESLTTAVNTLRKKCQNICRGI
ncbi:Calpain-like protease palB/RIM13 [Hypsizygus marmoreus]|uniref:Calpain-like protease palB/RIM13 n=1 Tax=Hypsizygus marmoreus TaxID=39966 RepID=A0A369JRQ6_HYPMA|nr:Calpain-like protease palB/RIM13 [Hypsizygus marmoreus]